jgi:hypothetical protein
LDSATDPFILQHDLAKYLHLAVASKVAGQTLAGSKSADRVTVELDAHRIIDGRESESLRLLRIVNGNFAQDNDNVCAQAIAVALMSAPAEYVGQFYNLIEPSNSEVVTQGHAGKRLELTGVSSGEENTEAVLIARRVYELPLEKAETWANREGLSATERQNILVSGKPVASQRFSRSEAVAVQGVVGSRKDRR